MLEMFCVPGAIANPFPLASPVKRDPGIPVPDVSIPDATDCQHLACFGIGWEKPPHLRAKGTGWKQ